MEFLWFLESIRTPFLTLFFQFWTLFGEEMLIFGIICLLYWCIDKNLAYKIAFTMFISGMLVQNLKIVFRIERPWIRDPNFTPVQDVIDTATGYSFPSGHTQSSTSFFGTIAIWFKKARYRIVCIIVILMVGFSRMYLGVHTPADVIVSMILTTLTAVVASYIFDLCVDTDKHDLLIAIAFAVMSVFTIVLSVVLVNKGYIEMIHAADCCKLAGAGLGAATGWYIERKYIKFDTKERNILIQILKLAVGIGIAVAIKSGFKIIFGDSLMVNVLRYFVTVLWILAVYPFIILKIKTKKKIGD